MWIYRIIILVILALYFAYITTVLLHCANIIKLTYKRVDLKAIIPFYYWFKRY